MAELAVKSTTRVLSISSSSTPIVGDLSATDRGKALYRRALARVVLKEDDEAEKDLVEASKVVPGDEAVKKELEKVRARKKERREKEKKAFKGLFA